MSHIDPGSSGDTTVYSPGECLIDRSILVWTILIGQENSAPPHRQRRGFRAIKINDNITGMYIVRCDTLQRINPRSFYSTLTLTSIIR